MTDPEARVAVAEAKLAKARIYAQVAEDSHRRCDAASESLPSIQVAQAEAAYQLAMYDVQIAEARLAAARSALERGRASPGRPPA